MFFSITVGAKVEGRFGDFLPLSAAQLTSGAKIRRIQAVLKGVVVKSLPAENGEYFGTTLDKHLIIGRICCNICQKGTNKYQQDIRSIR